MCDREAQTVPMTSTHNVFAGAYLDRAAEYRADVRWLAKALRQERARFLLVAEGGCLASAEDRRLVLVRAKELPGTASIDSSVFLGMNDKAPVFAVSVAEAAPEIDAEAAFVDLRSLGGMLSPAEANLAAHAIGMIRWRTTQRFCSLCGHEAQIEAAGYASLCRNDECATRTFPRVDPAIIVLVCDDHGRCLLGRQHSWPEGMYSTIAGFVEPGESLEDAVVREVYEETNIETDAVRYASSQPWPFPASLMLGFRAHALTADIRRNDGELSDVRWLTREELRQRVVKLPARQSIARRLVDDWLNEDAD